MSAPQPPKTPTSSLLQSQLKTPSKEEVSLKHFTDEVVTGQIYVKHRDDDKTKIEVDNYVSLIENIMTIVGRITDAVSRVLISHYLFYSLIRFCYH